MVNLCCDQALIDFVNKAKCLDHNIGCNGWLLCLQALQTVFSHGCESLSGDFCKIWLLHWIKRLMTSNTVGSLCLTFGILFQTYVKDHTAVHFEITCCSVSY